MLKKIIAVFLAIVVPIVLVTQPLDFIWADEPVTPPSSTALTSGAYSLANSYTTNIEEFENPAAAVGLEFSRPNRGKIRFTNAIDLTNENIADWLRQLETKLSISQNTITLDTSTITGLANTQAVLTLYNVQLSKPQILVNGQRDTEGVVSNVLYDRTAKTLTFTVNHFTTFQAVEGSSSKNSKKHSSSRPQTCQNTPPVGSPVLFQIDTTSTSATLFFTPVLDTTDRYYVAYGYENSDVRFGTEIPYAVRDGVMAFTINDLEPSKKYAFWVRPGNGCATGEWSNWMEATTGMAQGSNTRIFYKN